MSRVRHYARGPAPHETDVPTSVCIDKFLDAILENQHRLEWFGSRTTDIITLQCLSASLHLKMSHVVPEGHQDYVYSIGTSSYYSGKRPEEVTLQVTDITKRWGRVKIIDEWFEPCSEKFDHAVATFDLIAENVNMPMTTALDKLSYSNAVHEACKLFSKT